MSSSVEEMEAEVAELPPHGHKSKQKTSAHETIKMNDEDEQNVEAGKDNDYDDEVLEPDSELSHRLRGSRSRLLSGSQNEEEESREGSITVLVSGPARPWEYRSFDGDTTVDSVLDMVEDDDGVPQYRIEYESGRIDHISLDSLKLLTNGKRALRAFQPKQDAFASASDSQSSGSSRHTRMNGRGKRARKARLAHGFVDTTSADLGSDDSQAGSTSKRRRLPKKSSNTENRRAYVTRGVSAQHSRAGVDFTDSDEDPLSAAQTRPSRRSTRIVKAKTVESDTSRTTSEEDSTDDKSDESTMSSRALRRTRVQNRDRHAGSSRRSTGHQSSNTKALAPSRRSARDRGTVKNMMEINEDHVEYAENKPTKITNIKGIVTKEVFRALPKDSAFRNVHSLYCDVCRNAPDRGPLVQCQGCSTSIHQGCLGGRSNRLHRVTKVGEGDFVLQCRRCIGNTIKADPTAPVLDRCQQCKKKGVACAPFSQRRTTKEEEKLRNDNGGRDPVNEVSSNLLNNAANVLFRCRKCHCAFHFEHLPPQSEDSESPENVEDLRDERLYEYRPEFFCKDCLDTADLKVEALVAWRPAKGVTYEERDTIDAFNHDQIEYLIKWEDKSYLKCTWMKGSWTYGVTHGTMRKAFLNQEDAQNEYPLFTAEEAIPEEYNIMEIILDVQYKGKFRPRSLEHGMENLDKFDEVLVKFQGLNYVDAVWEHPPDSKNVTRWTAFEAAAHEFFRGHFFEHDSSKAIERRQREFRAKKFKAMTEQPEGFGDVDKNFVLKPYQLDGMNFLRFNFHQKKNVILADDMGLGKTIQVIAFISALVKEDPECWPFLIVTPNSTCPNWRREIKTWAPELRVVAYYGGKAARELAKEYELYPVKGRGLAAHVVITSYEAPVDKDGGSRFFNTVKWAGLIVDEGQRLKNDKSLLYKALTALKTPFQCLLTGTPLQNNKRELWNLLAFLDKTKDAEALDAKYAELTEENLPEIHAQIRPHMLRRKKAEVLDLPPIAQVILPTSMSVLQKELCRSIIEKNPVLIRSILAKDDGKIHAKDRGNLNNIMMQLRKVLAHPFMYSARIEESVNSPDDELRILVEASSKMQLLRIMLPKLKERGHRVLMFSQFLDQLDLLEEFLHGIGLYYTRIDGKLGALEKQKRIDAFNASNSELFACLLSTRAGGVGINLATADTVIIMDPDFNPHQDMQALSRAHRIGQKNKVLVFQLMTRGTVEEKIMQIGRQKLALDQALIESIKSKDDPNDVDLATILKHGAKKLFDDDNTEDLITYDSASVDKLLDRSHLEATKTDESKTSESQFSFARVWENEKGEMTADIEDDPEAQAALPESVWVSILAKRLEEANMVNGMHGPTLGRGRRVKQNVIYDEPNAGVDNEGTPKKHRRRKKKTAEDDDFLSAPDSEVEAETADDGDLEDPTDLLLPGQSIQHGVSKEHQAARKSGKHVEQVINFKPQSHGTTGSTSQQSGIKSANNDARRDPNNITLSPNFKPSKLPNMSSKGHHLSNQTLVRNPLKRPSHIAEHVQITHHPSILAPTNLSNHSISCPSCKLAHMQYCSDCPQTLGTIQIRILLDELRKTAKAHPLYNQLREILAFRSDTRART